MAEHEFQVFVVHGVGQTSFDFELADLWDDDFLDQVLRSSSASWPEPFSSRLQRLLNKEVTLPRGRGFPRFWELLSYVLSKKLRERVYEPAHQDLLEMYFNSRKFRTKWARRWLTFAFTLRTIVLILDCIRVAATNRLAQFLFRFLPEPVRKWWISSQD